MRPTRPALHFETVAGAFQVIDISHPLIVMPPDAELNEVIEAWTLSTEPLKDWFCLVRDERHIYGYLAQDDESLPTISFNAKIGEHVNPIQPNQIVADTLSLLELIPLFKQHYFYFVLTRNAITHVVSFQEMDALPVKLCLFSLVMALEAGIVDCLLDPQGPNSVESYLQLLPEGRRSKAEELCRLKHQGRILPAQVLLCTNFIDKKTILLRSPYLLRLLPFTSKSETESFFDTVHKLRNQIAHSESVLSVLSSPDSLDDFIQQLRRVTLAVSTMRSV